VDAAGRAVGVLSRSDVLLAVDAGVDGAPVREVMSPAVIAVQPDAVALQAAVVMIRCMVRRVFVVDEDGTPVGVVSTTDLLRALKTLWGEPTAGRSAP
jgi:predicted transcriptional regulator